MAFPHGKYIFDLANTTSSNEWADAEGTQLKIAGPPSVSLSRPATPGAALPAAKPA